MMYLKCVGDNIVYDVLQYVVIIYAIIIISEHSFWRSTIKSIEFSNDSQIHTIEKEAFYLSSIESISIPKNLVDLKYGWCNEVKIKQINFKLFYANFFVQHYINYIFVFYIVYYIININFSKPFIIYPPKCRL